jgi:hypothetical protein
VTYTLNFAIFQVKSGAKLISIIAIGRREAAIFDVFERYRSLVG